MSYFDYAATTPVAAEAIEVMKSCLGIEGMYANPASSTHKMGLQARQIIEQARATIANTIHAQAKEIVFTSGATESNNLAIKGYLERNHRKGNHIITTAIEHKSVLDVCKYLENAHIAKVTYLKVNQHGCISLADLRKAIREDTVLISVMAVNNELGTLNPLTEIGEIAKKHNIAFHVDAAQALGKIAIDVEKMNIAMLSMSAHKCYGPKGVGALYVNRKVRINEQIHGGKHEKGMRSGTLATHQIAGFAAALEMMDAWHDPERLAYMREYFIATLCAKLSDLIINTPLDHSYEGIVNLSIVGIDGESLLALMSEHALSMGSACNSASVEPSHVLTAIGLTPLLAHATVRVSFGRYTTLDDVKILSSKMIEKVRLLRQLSPLWSDEK